MDFSGRYVIPASPETVWTALNDPTVLKYCIPGCEALEKTSPTDFLATAMVKIGPMKARFKGKVRLSELDAPHRCVISGEGQGGVAGFAQGDSEVRLEADGGQTVLTYTARASVGGKLAQIGQRLVDGAARQIADDFFGRFTQAITAAQPAPELLPDPEVEEARPTASAVPAGNILAKRDGLAPEIWVVGLIGVVVILLLIFGTVL